MNCSKQFANRHPDSKLIMAVETQQIYSSCLLPLSDHTAIGAIPIFQINKLILKYDITLLWHINRTARNVSLDYGLYKVESGHFTEVMPYYIASFKSITI